MLLILNYVDPGSGFVFGQNASFLWGIILGLIGSLFLFFRLFFRFFKKLFWVIFILLIILSIGGLMMHKHGQKKKVIILGIDGMDPNITEQLIQKGRLPNFSYLKTMGTYSHLKTIVPAESVVCWTSFATGLNPGSHGIFDFVMRDPKQYLPYLSLTDIRHVTKAIYFGRIKIPIIDTVKVVSRQKGKFFWNFLSQHKIPAFIYFCPNTFPAQPLFGKMLSGMGVPDLLGTMDKFSFYTTQPLTEEDTKSRGRIIHVDSENNIIKTYIYGPKMTVDQVIAESKIPLRIILYSDKQNIVCKFQGNRLVLNQGTWSEWQRISFKIDPFVKVYGIVRFYLKSISPDFELYASPINIDPQEPLFPISYPNDYSRKLAKLIGSYYTQGMPHDTWVLTEKKLDEKIFLELVDNILQKRIKILTNELKDFKGGILFFYFETLDIIQHMFWRYLDPSHPLYEKGSLYQDTIFKYYEEIDRLLGELLESQDKNTILIVLSDHGFNCFRKSVNLNRWLLENGFLFLKPGIIEGEDLFEDVDWSKTKAYTVGFGGIYLNKIGREYYGIVNESEAQELKQSIAAALKKIKDPQTGEMVINNVYFQEDVFKGPYINDAPDLFVGFNYGYRASWESALGETPEVFMEDNRKKWSGEHLIDPSLVPGVIFINRKVKLDNPEIIDIAPTVLDLFNISRPKIMQGKVLFNNEDK